MTAAELPLSEELLHFYQGRLEACEKEREEAIQAIENLTPTQEEHFRLERECSKRTDEVKELQKALSDAHNFLFEERERLLNLQAENDSLKLQEHEDRSRIQNLLALTQPVTQEVTYARDRRPDTVTLFPRYGLWGNGSGAAAIQPSSDGQAAKTLGQGQERVLKTVYLPAEETDSLVLKIEALQAQLDEQRAFSQERIAGLLEDRRIRERDYEAHYSNDARRVQELQERLDRKEELLQKTTKDLLLLQHGTRVAGRKAEEAHARLKAEADAATIHARKAEQQRELALELLPTEAVAIFKHLRHAVDIRVDLEWEHEHNVRHRSEAGAGEVGDGGEELAQRLALARHEVQSLQQSAKSSIDQQREADVSSLRDQIRARDESVRSLETMHAAVRAQYEERIAQLEGRLSKLKEQYKTLEYRRVLDVEGFTNEVTSIRKQLALVEKKLHEVLAGDGGRSVRVPLREVGGADERRGGANVAMELRTVKERLGRLLSKMAQT